MSTQLLESLFGQYKQLEGQQSKRGFTGLVSRIPLLHRIPTPVTVRESSAEVTKKQVADWATTHVGRTLTSQRRAACAEHRKDVKGAAGILVLTYRKSSAHCQCDFSCFGESSLHGVHMDRLNRSRNRCLFFDHKKTSVRAGAEHFGNVELSSGYSLTSPKV